MQTKITIKPRGKIFEGKAPGIIRKNLLGAMHEAIAYLEREVKERTPVGMFGSSGGLRGSIAGVVKSFTSIGGVVAVTGQAMRYGEVVEKGRRPNKAMPPEGSLVSWIQQRFGVDAETAAKIEFPVRRKIGKEGFEGAHMFEEALKQGESTVTRIFDKMGFDISFQMGK